MSSVAGAVSMVLVLSVIQLVRWRWLAPDLSLRRWLSEPRAWGGWTIVVAVATYMLTLLAAASVR